MAEHSTRENQAALNLARMQAYDRNQLIMNHVVADTAKTILSGIDTDKVKVKTRDVRVVQHHDNNDKSLQQQIRNQNGTWSDELRGTIDLYDKATGKTVDTADMKLADVPKLTDRNTYVIGGNEYQFTTQARLKPGVYTKTQNNGEISAFFNVDKTVDFDRGFNNNFKITFNPEEKAFWLQYGQKNIPLITALRALGKNDSEIKKDLGEEVYQANSQRYDKSYARDMAKFSQAVFGKMPDPGKTSEEIGHDIRERLFATRLDPETTKITLGKPYENVNGQVITDTVKKIIDIHKGKVEGDERDSPIFKSFVGPEDIIREAMVKNAKNIQSNIGYKLGKTMAIRKSMSSQSLNPFVSGTLVTSKLSNPPSQVNVMSALGDGSKLTIMGEGGIGSANAISDEARQISNSDMGFIDPLHTPEGGSIGVVNHTSNNTVRIGQDIYAPFHNLKTGKKEMLRPIDVYDKVVAFPDQHDKHGSAHGDAVKAVHRGKLVEVKPGVVDYRLPKVRDMFDYTGNSIPFLSSIQGNRGLTASKMQEQALPLIHRDAPLFKIVDEDGVDLHREYGQAIGIPRSPVDGTVEAVHHDKIMVKAQDGKVHDVGLYHNFSLNNESFLHNEPTVKPGDVVTEGQTLAESNNTRGGRLALGANLKVAYVPWHGYNYEDSAIISQSGADKLTSEHIYDFKAKRSANGVFNRDKYRAYYPEHLTHKNSTKLDADGVVKPGTVVEHGDVVIAHLEHKTPTADDIAMKRLDKQTFRDMADHAQVWESGHRGVVTGVEKKGKDVVVSVKTMEPLQVGDKISGLHGNKHIISAIVPDHDMPMIKSSGEHIELTMNPLGVVNRINTSQTLENAAGKLAMKTGQPYEIHQMSGVDTARKLLTDMKAAGVQHKDVMIDPSTGRELKTPVANGYSHILKLEHKVDHKFSARYRQGHDSNEQAVSGGETGGKNLGRMEIAAMLARGAYSNLDEMFNIKGQRNDEFWRAVEMGKTPPPPKTGFAWEKFQAMLRGAGVNVEKNGKVLGLLPLTDKDIDQMSHGRLDNAIDTYRKKDMAPIKGGLFDPVKAGGMQGDKYTHFDLPEPILNPAMEDPAATVLGLTGSGLQDIIKGKSWVDAKGGVVPSGTPGAISGGPGLKRMLDKIDPDEELTQVKSEANATKDATKLNKLNRKAHYLETLAENKMKPSDYLISKVLVVPSKYRPMFAMGADNTVIMSDVNYLYQQAAATANAMTDLKSTLHEASGGNQDLQTAMLADVRGSLYDDVKAVTGFGDPTSFLNKQKGRKGFMSLIDGGDKQTKEGYFQDKVMTRRQDLVGRSTVTLNPNLGPDEMGVPRAMIDEIFQPFIMKKLVSWGYTPLEAKKQITDGTSVMAKARDAVIKERPIIANRAPTLHRWNMTGMNAVLTEGKTIEVPSIVISRNYGGDFDGDTFQLHVPIGHKAIAEVRAMMPSQSTLKHGYDTVLNTPDLDILTGAWLASKGRHGVDRTDVKFADHHELDNALKQGRLDDVDTVDVHGVKATAGMHVINSVIPEEIRRYDKVLDKKAVNTWLSDIAKSHGDAMSVGLADKMKEVGNRAVTAHGLTLGVEDTLAMTGLRKKALKDINLTKSSTSAEIGKQYFDAKTRLMAEAKTELGEDSALGVGLTSGGSKGIDQVINIVGMPGIVADAHGRPIPMPITHSYSEGLSAFDYWAAAHGARSGNIQKSVSSYKPGWLTKDLINSIYPTKIAHDEAIDTQGVEYDIGNSKAIANRYLARPVTTVSGSVLADVGTHLDNHQISALKRAGIKTVHVMSPLTDPTPGDSFSSMSYGTDHKNKRPTVGTDIGVISAHTITEPSLNMAMKAFHTGGVFTGKTKTAFDVLDQTMRFTHVPDRAAVAGINGRVKTIHRSSVGGYDVELDGPQGSESLYVHPNNALKIAEGSTVVKGQALDHGEVDVHDVLRTQGMPAAQRFLVDKIDKINGHELDTRDIETLVRGITNTTRVMKDKTGRFIPGDLAPLTTIDFLNNNRDKDLEPEHAVGYVLRQSLHGFDKGHEVTPTMAHDFSRLGVKTIAVTAPEIHHEPFLMPMGIAEKASISHDWLARMAHTKIKNVVSRGAAQGWTSDISGKTHPIPMLVASGYQGERGEI